jgi:hypothetical protein
METIVGESELSKSRGTFKNIKGWSSKGFRLSERATQIPLAQSDLEVVRVSAGGAYALVHYGQHSDGPIVSGREWDTATMADLGRLREAYKRLEVKLEQERFFSSNHHKVHDELTATKERELILIERVATLEVENDNLRKKVVHLQAEVDDMAAKTEKLQEILQARNTELKNINLKQTLERSEIEKTHFEDMELMRKKFSDILLERAAEAEEWSNERAKFQIDVSTLKNRLERFLSTEACFCRLLSLCAHVQEAIQALIMSGRLFDATYRSLRRQQQTLEQERAEQLHRAISLHIKGFNAEAQDTYESLFGDDPENTDVLYNYMSFLAFGIGDTRSALNLIKSALDAKAAAPRRQTARALTERMLDQLQAEMRRVRQGLFAIHQHAADTCAEVAAASGLAVSGAMLTAAAAQIPAVHGWTLVSDRPD